ncbi:hypothetical protein THAOC_03751, partial [Thalassiosira oceanica]
SSTQPLTQKLLSGQTVTSENGKATVHLIVAQEQVRSLSLNDDTELAFVVLPSKESNGVFHEYLCNDENSECPGSGVAPDLFECVSDLDCGGSLRCGYMNCGLSNWCNEVLYTEIDLQQGSRNMETCCSEEFPWEGDCDNDGECLSNLVCGNSLSCDWGEGPGSHNLKDFGDTPASIHLPLLVCEGDCDRDE